MVGGRRRRRPCRSAAPPGSCVGRGRVRAHDLLRRPGHRRLDHGLRPRARPARRSSHNFMDFFIEESCGYCTPCRVGNVLLQEDARPRSSDGQGEPADLDVPRDLAHDDQDHEPLRPGPDLAQPGADDARRTSARLYEARLRPATTGTAAGFDSRRGAATTAEASPGRHSGLYARRRRPRHERQPSQFTIDGAEVHGQARARPSSKPPTRRGVYIPRSAATKGLSPPAAAGSARCGSTAAQAACTQPVAEGMAVENDTAGARGHAQGHRSRCSSSRATTSACSARRAATASCRPWPTASACSAPRTPTSSRSATSTPSHPDVLIDHNRCILCGRCVRAIAGPRRQSASSTSSAAVQRKKIAVERRGWPRPT